MRIVAGGFEVADPRALLGLAVAVLVAQAKDLAPRGDVDRAVVIDGQVHRVRRPLEEDADLAGLARRRIEVVQEQNAVGLRSRVARRRKVRVALDHQHAALVIDGDASRRDDVRLRGDELDLKAVVEDSRRGDVGGGERRGEEDQGGHARVQCSGFRVQEGEAPAELCARKDCNRRPWSLS